jgi:osmotically-inducible protein OsmY
VSRANLLQALAALRRDIPVESRLEDSVLHERVISEIKSKLLASASQINVIVHDGVVELWGAVDTQDEKDALAGIRHRDPSTVESHRIWHHGDEV